MSHPRRVGALFSRRMKLMIGKEIADQLHERVRQKVAAKMLGLDRQHVAYIEQMALFKVYALITMKHRITDG